MLKLKLDNACKVIITFKSLKNIAQSYVRILKYLAVFKECDRTLFCIFLSVFLPGLSLISVFILLAVFIDAPPNTSTMILLPLGHFCILSSKPTKCMAHISWSSLFSIQGQLIPSSVTFLSSLLIILASIVFTVTSVFLK